MRPFRYAHAAAADWRGAVDEVITRLGNGPGNLGFLYLTDSIGAQAGEVLEAMRDATGVEQWVGAVGIGICATGIEYYERPALAVMIADLPADSFRVFPSQVRDLNAFDADQRAWLGSAQPYLALVHGDPANPRLEDLIRDLAERIETGFLVGGLASSSDAARAIANEVVQGGLSGVLFTAAVGVQTSLSQGCSPIGPHRRITEAERNVLVQLDGRPALDVFREDIGEGLARDLSQVSGYIFVGLPIPGSDTGDYLVRNLIGVDLQRKLVGVGEMLETGGELMFCRRDADSAREDLSRMLANLRGRLQGPPRGGIYVSCLGRGTNLFGEQSEELCQIRDELGDFPLVGFYANGEVFRDQLYGYTGVLTLFT
ncbi:MAG: histidine kinase [Chromatiaceae bacterium]|nr:MAG: histidine kinase [Chromatiaceae bacterium]